MTRRSSGGTCGTGRTSIDRITTCSLSACRCSTISRIASGVVTFVRLRNTAVPGTRSTGSSRACSSSMNVRSDPSSRSRRWATIARPFCHVVITVKATRPMRSGSHAPWPIFVRFAARNSTSIDRSAPPPTMTSQRGTLQRRAAT